MPLGGFLLLAGGLVLPCVRGCHTDVANRVAIRHGPNLGISSEISNENHQIYGTHIRLPVKSNLGILRRARLTRCATDNTPQGPENYQRRSTQVLSISKTGIFPPPTPSLRRYRWVLLVARGRIDSTSHVRSPTELGALTTLCYNAGLFCSWLEW